MLKNELKKNHWVPQCYLKNFTTTDGSAQVFMYQYNKETILVGIDKVAAKNNLYTFPTKTGGQSKDIEKLFATLEAAAAPILEKIIKQESLALTDNEKGWFVQFVTFLITRGPSFSDWQRNSQAEIEKWRMKIMAEHPEALKKHFAEAGITFKTDKEFTEMREALLNFDKYFKIEMKGGASSLFKEAVQLTMDLIPYLGYTKSWHLLISDGQRVFVTSDNPVIIQQSVDFLPQYASGYGYGTLFLPLSPKICFVMRNVPIDKEVLRIGAKAVDYINGSIMKDAHRQIYANIKSKDIKRLRDRFQPGVESQVISNRLWNSPYVITTGGKKDIELQDLIRHSDKSIYHHDAIKDKTVGGMSDVSR